MEPDLKRAMAKSKCFFKLLLSGIGSCMEWSVNGM